MTVDSDEDVELADSPEPAPSSLTRVLMAVIAVAVVAIAVAGGFAWGHSSRTSPAAPYVPGPASVDGGFARDMATHHQQAITMATYAFDNSTDPDVRNLAYDIESSQTIEMGEMEGWLLNWNISRTSGTPMNWMPAEHRHLGPGGLMPGMATPAQMNRLLSSHGKALDVLFLQLMIRHHQGGLPMEQWAVQHAREPYVRDIAQSMLNDQQPQIIQMEQMLRGLGASPLPPPQD